MGYRRRGALEGSTPHPEGEGLHEGALPGVPRTGRRAPPEGPETGLPRGIAALSRPGGRMAAPGEAGKPPDPRRPPPAPAPGRNRPLGIRGRLHPVRGGPPDARLRSPAPAGTRRTALTAFAGCPLRRWAGPDWRPCPDSPLPRIVPVPNRLCVPVLRSARAVRTALRRRTAIRGSSPCRRVASPGAAWGGRFCVTQIDPPRGPPLPFQSPGKPWSACAGIAAGKNPGSLPPPWEFAGTNAGAKTTE